MQDELYQERVKNEIKHYSSYLKSHGEEVLRIEPTVSAFGWAMRVYGPDINQKGLGDYPGRVLARVESQSETALASLGCGTGDWELDLVRRSGGRLRTVLYDLNADLLNNVSRETREAGLPLTALEIDVNRIELEPSSLDFVLFRSSLHHFVELEHIFAQVRAALKPGGEVFVLGEVVGRNGLQLYPDTEDYLNRVFRELPTRLRKNQYTGEIDERVPNIDHSVNSFEAVRSQDIFPLLMENFRPVEYAAIDAIISPLLDFRYGPNYDLTREEDRALASIIGETDRLLTQSHVLKPTALHGIFQ